MKIAQIAPPWIRIPPKNYGGTENILATLVDAQVALGHDVTLFAPASSKTTAKLVSFFPQALLDEGVPWHAHLKAFYHLESAIEQIKEEHFDIVHTHLSSSADLYIFPLTASLSTPHISTLHSHFPFDHAPGGWVGDADNYYMKWAPAVPIVAISESARREEGRYPLRFVDTIYHGIDVDLYRPQRRKQEDFFIWIGRFIDEKGPHLAIEAAKRANVPLVLAGTIDRHRPESMNYFYEQIKPQVDGKQIKYIGPVDTKRKIGLLNRACGFLNPIEWNEPFGMVMVEAMAVGCPVITFARGAAPELIVDGETGFLVQNVEEMVERISQIREIRREAVRAHVVQHFSAQVMAENYIRAYQELLDS